MKHAKYLIVTLLLTPIFAGGLVAAQVAPTGDRSNASSGTSPAPASSQELIQRLKSRKEKASRRFTSAEQSAIRSRCVAAQGLVSGTEARVKSFAAQRTAVYTDLLTRLKNLDTKLKAAGANTGRFSQQLVDLQAKVDAYAADFTKLNSAFADMSAMDCASDPEAFAATLIEARQLRASVSTKGKEIRSLLKDSVKPALTAAKAQTINTQIGEDR